jgi:putative sterol carrier protein
MARFLSHEWLAELNRAIASDEEVRQAGSGVHLTLQQVVVGADGSATCYSTRVDDGLVELTPGRAEGADVTITEDYETAAALAQGKTTPQDAILAGKVRVSGNLRALLAGQEVLDLVRGRFEDVRARTEY